MPGTDQMPRAGGHGHITMESVSQVGTLPTHLVRKGLVEELVLAWLALCWKEDFPQLQNLSDTGLLVVYVKGRGKEKWGRGQKSKLQSLRHSWNAATWQTTS